MLHSRYHRILPTTCFTHFILAAGDNDDAICGACGNFGFWRVVIIPRV